MKQIFQIYKLHFSAPLHLSLGKNEYDKSAKTLHSDTLKSALLSCAYLLGYNEEAAQEILQHCVFSSAFPFYGKEYFFPKPFTKIQQVEGVEEEKQGKALKKIQFFGKNYFERLLNGAAGTIKKEHLFDKNGYVSDHPVLELLKKEDKSIIASSVNQRVSIAPDHIEDATPFYTERLFFPKETGLWFIIDLREPTLSKKVEGLMHLLGDNGIGTDRSVGNGFFTPELSELTLELPAAASHQTNLSLYCPIPTELTAATLDQSAWQLKKRGGYIAGTTVEKNISLRKRSVYMFEEGSIFPKGKLEGKIVNLRPKIQEVQHAIWRDGRSIFLPIQPALI